MNRLAINSARAHHRALEAASGVQARVRRHDTNDSVGVRLVPAATSQAEFDQDGASTTARYVDWLVLETDWLEQLHRHPEDRDEIDLVVDHDHQRRTFKVVRADEARPWQYADNHRSQIRIHSVEIAPFSE